MVAPEGLSPYQLDGDISSIQVVEGPALGEVGGGTLPTSGKGTGPRERV